MKVTSRVVSSKKKKKCTAPVVSAVVPVASTAAPAASAGLPAASGSAPVGTGLFCGRSTSTINFICRLQRLYDFSIFLSSPEPVTPEKICFQPLQHRKFDTKFFWNEKITSTHTALFSTSLHQRLFFPPTPSVSEPPRSVPTQARTPTPSLLNLSPPFFTSRGSVGFFSGSLRFFSVLSPPPKGFIALVVRLFTRPSAASTYG